MDIIGIYGIFNKDNSKIYIGSSIRIIRRWKEHLTALKHGKHWNKYLQRSWSKYGDSSFQFHILEMCGRDVLVSKELAWIDFLRPSYNMRIPNTEMDGFTFSPKMRQSISERNRKRSPEIYRKVSQSLSGRTVSKETGRRISAAKRGVIPVLSEEQRYLIGKGRRGKVVSSETCRKLSEAAQRREQRKRDDLTQGQNT